MAEKLPFTLEKFKEIVGNVGYDALKKHGPKEDIKKVLVEKNFEEDTVKQVILAKDGFFATAPQGGYSQQVHGWIRNLTREGIEPNPGPGFTESQLLEIAEPIFKQQQLTWNESTKALLKQFYAACRRDYEGVAYFTTDIALEILSDVTEIARVSPALSMFKSTFVAIINQLHNSAPVTPPQQGSVIINYRPAALSATSFAFDAIPEVIRIHEVLVKESRLNSNEFTTLPWISVTANLNAREIATLIVGFSKNQKNGTAEDSLHHRDDFLFGIIREISTLQIERNSISDSTHALTRLDGYLYTEGWPPSIIFEEKAKDSQIADARSDIQHKFLWLPHYHKLQFIIAIAIAGDTVEFSKLSQAGFSDQVVFSLARIDERFGCIQAAINVGRWALWVKQQSLLERLDIPMNRAQTDAAHRRKLVLTFKGVEKTYLNLNTTAKIQLLKFYRECQTVPYLERLVNSEKPARYPDQLRLYLSPLGIPKLPATESELGHAFVCICKAVDGLHDNNWTHNDIRWPNIIFYQGDWILIDCEFVRQIGDPLPNSLPLRYPNSTSCCVQSDLYLLGQLLAHPNFASFGTAFNRLQQLLQNPQEVRTVNSLRKNPWLARYWK